MVPSGMTRAPLRGLQVKKESAAEAANVLGEPLRADSLGAVADDPLLLVTDGVAARLRSKDAKVLRRGSWAMSVSSREC
jgi:hypothetical protein